MMKNHFQSITNIKVIFILFSYVSPNKMFQLIEYLYPLLNNVNNDRNDKEAAKGKVPLIHTKSI